MQDVHLDLKQIVAKYKVSRATVLRWKRLGKFSEEDILEMEVGKGTIKYLYSIASIERILAENDRLNRRGTYKSKEQPEEESATGGYKIAIDLLKERVEELKEENAQLKEEVALLTPTNRNEPETPPPPPPTGFNQPQPTTTLKEEEQASNPVNNKPNKSFDWGWFTVFIVGILLLAFVYYIETAY